MKKQQNLYSIIILLGILSFPQVFSSHTDIHLNKVSNQIAACYEHTLVIQDGKLMSWGSNESGQLGNGTIVNRPSPTTIFNLENVKSIANGSSGNHSIAIDKEGRAWSWGNNESGQLGIGNHINWTVPQEIEGISNVRQASVGGEHSLALDKMGRVWSWGKNYNGQLGDPIKLISSTPLKVRGMDNSKAVSAGFFHSLSLQKDGTVWSWGKNSHGQLGITGLKASRLPVKVENLKNISSISAGNSHNIALDKNGQVWTWGWNDYGQLGNGTDQTVVNPQKINIENVIAVAGGGVHSIALKADGTVWGWGCNLFGQLGNNDSKNIFEPQKIDYLEEIVAISAGDLHNVALKADGTIITWGVNEKGQIGKADKMQNYPPVAILQVEVPEGILAFAENKKGNNQNWVMKGANVSVDKSEQPKHFLIPENDHVLIDTVEQYFQVSSNPSRMDTAASVKATTYYQITDEINADILDCPVNEQIKTLQINLDCMPQNTISIKWEVDINSENVDFNIEKSKNGKDWVNINPSQFMTEANDKILFEAKDADAIDFQSFYRLKQIDCSGNEKHSTFQKIRCH